MLVFFIQGVIFFLKVNLLFAEMEIRYGQQARGEEGEGRAEGGISGVVACRSLSASEGLGKRCELGYLLSSNHLHLENCSPRGRAELGVRTSPHRLQAWSKGGPPGETAPSFLDHPSPRAWSSLWQNRHRGSLLQPANDGWKQCPRSAHGPVSLRPVLIRNLVFCSSSRTNTIRKALWNQFLFNYSLHMSMLYWGNHSKPYSTQLLPAAFLKVSMWLWFQSIATVNIQLFINYLTGTIWSPFE